MSTDHEMCEVCGLSIPRADGEPAPAQQPRPGIADMCLLEHHLTWWQRRRMSDDKTTQPAPLDMINDLHRAVYGDTWARPLPPKVVWEMLLAEVEGAVAAASRLPKVLAERDALRAARGER